MIPSAWKQLTINSKWEEPNWKTVHESAWLLTVFWFFVTYNVNEFVNKIS